MNGPTPTRSYRNAYRAALALNVVLLLVLGFLWWNGHEKKTSANSPVVNKPEHGDANPVESVSNRAADIPPEAALAPIQLTPERMQSIGIKLGVVKSKAVNSEIRATGNVEVDERQIAYVQSRFAGWIRQVYADASYQFVQKGQPLFTIYSPDLVATEQEYLLAEKTTESLKSSTVPGVSKGAQSLLSAAIGRLTQWEVPATEIQRLGKTRRVITELPFNSPVSGYITERNALPNLYVQPETRLYTIADLSTIWVYAQVFQTDLGKIRVGGTADVTVDSYPGRTFHGKIDYVVPQIDVNTRTARVRVVLPNPELKLTPGMYVNVLLQTPLGRHVVAPSSAIFQSGTRQLIFIDRGNGQFQPREVEPGPQVGDETVILKGVKPGESIVTSANFLIDSESQLQAGIGAYTPSPSAGTSAGANASSSGPMDASQGNIELSSQPSPLQKGQNVFSVKVSGKDGAPISGADVTITLYMPAMPEMNMAAMKTIIHCGDKGGGLYEGAGELESGGTWQVTLVAQSKGQMVASKRLTLRAAGGM